MTRALDRVICGVYREVPASAAVTCLLAPCETPELPGAAPGAARPPRRESIMTRYVRGVRQHWATSMRFPNPLQAVVLASGFGLCFLLGGPERLASPAFIVIRENGGATIWGMGYITVSVALFITWRLWRHGLFLAYVAAASGYLSFAVATFRPAWEQPSVNYLACFLAAWLAWVHAMAATRSAGEWRIERWWKAKRAARRRR